MSSQPSLSNEPKIAPKDAPEGDVTDKRTEPSSSKKEQEEPRDVAALMGFGTFGSTKNKKVQPKISGGKRVEKPPSKNKLKYRQYVNRKSKKLVQ